ncbi:hypothetical protein [Streptomyces sp. NPDC004685]
MTDYPVSAHVQMQVLGAHGLPEESEGYVVRVTFDTDEDRPGVGQLQIKSSLSAEWEGSEAGSSRRWSEFVHGMATRLDPTFGHICDDALNHRYTGRDTAGGRRGVRRSIRMGREILRGYSWVTVVPKELALSLGGGAAALERTGAFYQVDELHSGAVWLQASENIEGYDEAVMEKVFEALAPVLPSGMPRRDPFRKPRLVWRDPTSVVRPDQPR